MKTTLKIFLFLVVAFGFSATAMAQTESTSATATATLITPLSITTDANLSFGTITSSGTSGSATVAASAAGGITQTGGVKIISGTTSAAKFTVTGENGKAITVSFTSPINLTYSGTDLSLALKTDVGDGTTGQIATLATSVPYNKVIYVGGTLTVPENTPAGVYTNNTGVKITVNYQ